MKENQQQKEMETNNEMITKVTRRESSKIIFQDIDCLSQIISKVFTQLKKMFFIIVRQNIRALSKSVRVNFVFFTSRWKRL